MPISPDAPRRALYCTDTYAPQVNGVSVVTALSVDGLRDRGWEVGIVAPSYPDAMPDPFGRGGGHRAPEYRVSLPGAPMPGYRDLRLSLPLPHLVARAFDVVRPAIVHCATEFVIGRLGQRAALQRGIPVVTSYHTDFSKYTASYGVPWMRGAVARSLAAFHRRSRRIYTPSEPAREDLRAWGLVDVEVWGRGVDTAVFHPRHRDPSLHTAYAGDGAVVFLHVGRLAAEKDIEVLIRAFLAARERLAGARPIRLIVAGEGPREAALRALAGDHVSFLGNLDRHRMLPRLYASCDAFLFASATETLGLVILEAMASGLPVIATRVGGNPELVDDESTGRIVPSESEDALTAAILRYFDDPATARRHGGAARSAVVRRFSLDRMVQDYRALYDSTRKHRPAAAARAPTHRSEAKS